MAAAQGTAYINPMAALATHATLNGMANSVVPPTSGKSHNILLINYTIQLVQLLTLLRSVSILRFPSYHVVDYGLSSTKVLFFEIQNICRI